MMNQTLKEIVLDLSVVREGIIIQFLFETNFFCLVLDIEYCFVKLNVFTICFVCTVVKSLTVYSNMHFVKFVKKKFFKLKKI